MTEPDTFELKRLTEEGIDGALEKAERYRLLNEPMEAESICRDVLEVSPGHPKARITLVLALTDRFEGTLPSRPEEAMALVAELESEYERAYYEGIVHERRAKKVLLADRPGAGENAYAHLRDAMACYERAEALEPAGTDDAILRYNTCARIIRSHPHVCPGCADDFRPMLE